MQVHGPWLQESPRKAVFSQKNGGSFLDNSGRSLHFTSCSRIEKCQNPKPYSRRHWEVNAHGITCTACYPPLCRGNYSIHSGCRSSKWCKISSILTAKMNISEGFPKYRRKYQRRKIISPRACFEKLPSVVISARFLEACKGFLGCMDMPCRGSI